MLTRTDLSVSSVDECNVVIFSSTNGVAATAVAAAVVVVAVVIAFTLIWDVFGVNSFMFKLLKLCVIKGISSLLAMVAASSTPKICKVVLND